MFKVTDQLRVISFLKHFGCNSRESLAYIEALKSGPTTVQELSRKLRRNRITVHYSVQQLVKKGLLFETVKGKKKLVSAEKPEVLSRIIDQRHTELKALEANLDYVSNLLGSIQTSRHEITMVKLYEGAEGFKKMLEETLEAKNELLIFTTTELFSTLLGEEYMFQYFTKRAERGIRTRIIYPPTPFAKKVNEHKEKFNIDLRILSQDQRSEAGFYLWNNVVALKSLKEDKRSCTLIENRDIANFFRNNIFNHFWAEAKPLDAVVE